MYFVQVTKYTAAITSVWDGDHSGLHLNLKTESTQKYELHWHPISTDYDTTMYSRTDLMKQARQAMNFAKPGPKSTKVCSSIKLSTAGMGAKDERGNMPFWCFSLISFCF